MEAAREVLDFSGGRTDDPRWRRIGERQLEGAVALFNRLAHRRIVWLADEVGMGKTFVALGVAALLRRQNPNARILFLLPSSRLQPKWRKERIRFTRSVWRDVDHRVRGLGDLPVRALVEARRLRQLAAEMVVNPDRDAIAPMSAFSFGLSDDETGASWQAEWRALAKLSAHLPDRLPPACVRDKQTFKRVYAAALNLLLPTYDLVVCDESHNLRRGASHGASRNQTLAAALAGKRSWEEDLELPWAAPAERRVDRLLCLTATPVEHDFSEMTRQAEVFGLTDGDGDSGSTPSELASLANLELAGDERKETARRFIIRRVQEFDAHGQADGPGLTKNQYRREWRAGGVAEHDSDLRPASPRERLMVALVQKRVIEALHRSQARSADGTFLPSFQMGMLSSFESFHETISRRVSVATEQPTYDGEDQTKDANERRGLDSLAVDELCRSYRERFGVAPPHPKMNEVARQAAEWAWRGEKSLVFVRRVRTTEELADTVQGFLDERLAKYLRAEVPDALAEELEQSLAAYASTRRSATAERPVDAGGDDEHDEGGASSLFAYVFRGAGKEPHQLGARLRRESFQRHVHPWSILLLDNHVLWLFGDRPKAVEAWAQAHPELEQEAREWVRDVKNVGHRHLYEAWQAAALQTMATDQALDARVRGVADALRERLYPHRRKRPWPGDVDDSRWLLRRPFFARLRRSLLTKELWPGACEIPDVDTSSGMNALRDREVRRELMASVTRLGHAGVDLWLTAVNLLGASSVGAQEADPLLEGLGDALLKRLESQRQADSGLTAWAELRGVAEHHDLLLEVNFPEIHEVDLPDLTRWFQHHLGRQSPAVAMHGGSKSTQAMTQFRMPGYPLVLVATDVLQEGVDLHTFCARAVHYGIAHTSSATEQRTGRVDRIGSLVHRRLGAAPESKLQIHYPHLKDTVEPLQMEVLYGRMDRFLRLVHDGLGSVDDEPSKIRVDRGMQRDISYPDPPTGRLESAFGVAREGRRGDLQGGEVAAAAVLDVEVAAATVERVVGALCEVPHHEPDRPVWSGEVWVHGDSVTRAATPDSRRQPFRVSLRTRRDGLGLFVRVDSPLGELDLEDEEAVELLLTAQRDHREVTVEALVSAHGAPKDGTSRVAFVHARHDAPLPTECVVEERVRAALIATTRAADDLESRLWPDQDMAMGEWPGREDMP